MTTADGTVGGAVVGGAFGTTTTSIGVGALVLVIVTANTLAIGVAVVVVVDLGAFARRIGVTFGPDVAERRTAQAVPFAWPVALTAPRRMNASAGETTAIAHEIISRLTTAMRVGWGTCAFIPAHLWGSV